MRTVLIIAGVWGLAGTAVAVAWARLRGRRI